MKQLPDLSLEQLTESIFNSINEKKAKHFQYDISSISINVKYRAIFYKKMYDYTTMKETLFGFPIKWMFNHKYAFRINPKRRDNFMARTIAKYAIDSYLNNPENYPSSPSSFVVVSQP